MRRSISLVVGGSLALGWVTPVNASEGPPVQRPGAPAVEPGPVVEAAPVEAAPVVEPATVAPAPAPPESQLPRYDVPIVVEPSTTKPRDPRSEKLIAAGSVLFCAGFPVTALSGIMLYDDSQWSASWERRSPWPPFGVAVGLAVITTGATLLGVGVTRHKRWKRSLAGGPARVQLQPTIGFAQLGVAGRF
jgi:hypothetical protein